MTTAREFLDEVLSVPKRIPPEVVAGMSPVSYARFLKNRRRLLALAYRLLRPISFQREKLEKRMIAIDEFVIKSADVIARSHRTGLVFTISLAAGLGLSERLVAKIKSERLRSWVPRRGGFYYVTALGFAAFVERTVKGRRLVIELVSDFDRLERILTYAGEISGAVNWGVAVDQASSTLLRARTSRMESSYVGILGVVRSNAEHFSYSLITGLAIPPYLPIGMVYTNRTWRTRIPVLKIPLSVRSKLLDEDT